MNLNTFWKQPAQGFNKETRGRTEAEICVREKQIGFKFPETYRSLMKLQNGGYIRKSSFYRNDECKELLYNGATIDKINPNPIGYQTMKDVLMEWMELEEMNSLSKTEFNYLNRLPLISHMDGHEWMCFDYGWTEKDEKKEPSIVFFNERFEEYLRLSNFEDFVNGLVYYGYESTEYHYGIYSTENIDDIQSKIGRLLNLEFEKKSDKNHGWFNFEKWYLGNLEVFDNHRFSISITPNKYIAQTYRFQEHPDLNYVISLTPYKEKYETVPNLSKNHRALISKIVSTIAENYKTVELLKPEIVNE